MKTMFKALLVIAALGFCMLPAHADQIFVCQSCTAPPGGDPNIISNTSSFDIGVAGGAAQQNPLIIIVAVYDGNGVPTITGATPTTVGTYGLTTNTGTLTTGTAFAALGLSAGGSDSFTNFKAGDIADGFAAPTSFKLYAFSLPVALGSSVISVSESGAALGSYILAYDCKAGTGSSTGCAKEGDVSQTVFTNTGIVDGHGHGVPEPGSLGLLGLGLLSLAAFTIRRPAANLA